MLPQRFVSTNIKMSDVPVVEEPLPAVPVTPVIPPRLNAKWFPFLGVKAPRLLDGTLPGDVGFDPLGFSTSAKTLYWMRDAEIKHARLAMVNLY